MLFGCAGQIKEVKKENETQNQVMGRLLGRIRALETEQNDLWVRQSKLELTVEDLREELKRVKYIILKDEETKCLK